MNIDKNMGEVEEPQWFRIYTYILLPLSLILSIAFAIKLGALFYWFHFAFAAILFLGLWKKKLWAWKLNFAFLIYGLLTSLGSEVLIYGENFASLLDWSKTSIDLLLGLAWLVPNWIYFKKRKHMFEGNINSEK